MSANVLFAALTLAGVAGAEPPRLIIDTDMSTDCDDVGATCIAHALMDRGEVNLIAVVHDTGRVSPDPHLPSARPEQPFRHGFDAGFRVVCFSCLLGREIVG